MQTDILFRAIDKLQEVSDNYFSSEELSSCVITHAAAAGVAAMAGGILPGAGAAIATVIASGAAWAMYIKISRIIDIKLDKKTLKVIASAALSNIASNVIGFFAFSFIPGLSIIADGIITFASVYIAAIVFLTVLTQVFKGNRTDIDDDAWKETVKTAASNINMRSILKEARGLFKEMKDSGALDDLGRNVDINPTDEADDQIES